VKIKELIAAAGVRHPERAAPQAPEQPGQARASGGSAGLTAEEAQGRRTLLMIAVGVWVPLIANTLATGLSTESVVLSALGVVATVGLVLGIPLARHATSVVLSFGVLAAVFGAVSHPWPVRFWYILTAISWGSAGSTLEYSDAIEAYEERNEEF
jgi:hypothetical protein